MAAATPSVALVLLMVLDRHLGIEGRVETGTLEVRAFDGSPQWLYAGKFGYGIGVGTYEARARVQGSGGAAAIDLEIILDEDWEEQQMRQPCSPSANVFTRKKRPLTVGQEKWGPPVTGKLEQKQRSHIWYFAVSRCPDRYDNLEFNTSYSIDFELHLRQFDGSELSMELQHIPCATCLSVLGLTAFIMYFIVRCWHLLRKFGEVHPVIQVLAASVLLQWTAQVLHLVHLQLYESAGIGESAAETFADVLFMLSQVVSSTLLIVIARGYTLLTSKHAELRYVRPLAAAIALLHVALVGHGKLEGDHSGKHHEYEGASGWAILCARVLLHIWFSSCVRELHWKIGAPKTQSFLQHFHLAGSLYFLSFPLLFVVVKLFAAPYTAHPIMHLGLVVMQLLSVFWLSKLFLSKGTYFEVSTLSSPLSPALNSCFRMGDKLQ